MTFCPPPRLLCVGTELDHLPSRRAVLNWAGYDTYAVMSAEAETLLRFEEFDLVIVSAWLSEREKGKILQTAGKMPVLVLTGFTRADKLLAQVEQRLRSVTDGTLPNP